MKQRLLISFIISLYSIWFFSSCKKVEETVIPVISYKIWGKIDTSKTNIPLIKLTNAVFTLSYSQIEAGIESNAVLNGQMNLLNYSGINNRDTLSLYTNNTVGIDTALVIANDSIRTIKTSNNYTFSNKDSARFSCNNLDFPANISANLKLGKGYFKIGRAPKYVVIKLDSVVKL
jgi:hypothetical protein